ncbi:MAG: hypothetical protein JJE04_25440 [Acidobacteriia bacterium]|nr:hypothetical protein [Terriglobia bacterium]
MIRFIPTLVAAICVSCGYVGDPLPPALNIPVPVHDLRVVQHGANLIIEFTAPAMTTDGLALRRLGGVDLRAGETQVPVDATEPGPVRLTVPVSTYLGQKVIFSVRAASHKMKWSDPTATATVDVIDPVLPPPDVQAAATDGGVLLQWKQGAVREGQSYRVRRKAPGQDAFMVAAEVKANQWKDAESVFRQTYAYSVQALVGAAESEVSAPVSITPIDTFAPAIPQNVAAVAGIGSVELTWDRGQEPDLSGYRIYRVEGDAAPITIGQVQLGPSYSDKTVRSGVAYRYAVSALDGVGNESKPSEWASATAP